MLPSHSTLIVSIHRLRLGLAHPYQVDLALCMALEIIRALGKQGPGLNIVGMDLVEVAPCYDQSQTTALAAAQICQELLCLLAASVSD